MILDELVWSNQAEFLGVPEAEGNSAARSPARFSRHRWQYSGHFQSDRRTRVGVLRSVRPRVNVITLQNCCFSE